LVNQSQLVDSNLFFPFRANPDLSQFQFDNSMFREQLGNLIDPSRSYFTSRYEGFAYIKSLIGAYNYLTDAERGLNRPSPAQQAIQLGFIFQAIQIQLQQELARTEAGQIADVRALFLQST